MYVCIYIYIYIYIQVLASHRVLLAPLRFGAGIKGKIVDAWRYGLPVWPPIAA